MKKKYLVLPLSLVAVIAVLGCHKKEVAPPPPPPPPVVEKKPEPPAKVDSTAIWARQRAEKLARAKSEIAEMKIFFDYDKSDIKPEARTMLMGIADRLKEYSDITIRIEGNCDERGTAAYNLALGERRANAAMQFLTDSGVAADRIETKSWGEERSVCQEHQESCWSQNRRDEFFTN